jgi:UDP-N-acetyl-D-mannosaminuronate dehydrogenase
MLDEAGGSLAGARVLIVGASYKPGVADTHESPAHEIARLLIREGAEVEYHDPLVASIRVGDRTLRSVTPDPRVDASGFGPEDYDLAIVVTVHPEHDYGWLERCPAVLDCTYETRAGRRWDVP